MNKLEELEAKLSEPSRSLVEEISKLEGNILILGVAGKIGPSLALIAKKAISIAGIKKRVIGVSRFSDKILKQKLENAGIETIEVDLLDEVQLQSLPDTKNVLYLVGRKFGTTGQEYLTWAMNSYLPGRVAEKFRHSRIVSFSTGNIYPLISLKSGSASEETKPNPLGEYAQSCLGRERIVEYFSHKYNIPIVQFRLNYAIGLGYGVLYDVAIAVKERKPIDLQNGNVNVIWQGDVNEYALRSFKLCSSPPFILNATGPEIISIRWLAERFGELFGVSPIFINEEQDTVLLSNASLVHSLFGYPRVTLREMIKWTWEWIEYEGQSLDKPTHFQERSGRF